MNDWKKLKMRICSQIVKYRSVWNDLVQKTKTPLGVVESEKKKEKKKKKKKEKNKKKKRMNCNILYL